MNDNSRQILDKKNEKTFQLVLASKFKYKIERVSILTTLSKKNIQVDNTTSNDIDIDCIKFIQIIVSELSFIILMFLSLYIVYEIPEYHSEKIITSKNTTNSNFDKDPIILIHTTDLHISTRNKEKTDGSTLLISTLCEYNPDLFLLTGDYVDNIDPDQEMGEQNLEDWKIYNITIKNRLEKKGFKVIDVSGNHDQWAVDTFNSEENNFLDNSFIYNRTNIKNESDFYLRKIDLNIDNNSMIFLLINEYNYPVYRPPYGLEVHTTIKQLDLLENTLNSLNESDIFVLTHYPVDRAWLLKSSKGNSFEEIISNEKIYAIFSGHEHPSNVKIVHHGEKGGLEFCTASAFNKKRAGLITLDNGNLVYHEVYIPYYERRPLFFLTYPVPNEQLTSHHIFNIRSFDIRVISYYPDININLKIEGDINGNLEYNHTLNNGAFLFIYHVDNMQEGKHIIHIYDEQGLGCNIKSKFYVGEKFNGNKEEYIGKINLSLALKFMIIPFFIFLLIIVFPFCPDLNVKVVKDVEKIIEGKIYGYNFNQILLYLTLICFSPFFYRLRLQSTSEIKKIIPYSIFIAFIYPLILPIHFMQEIKGKLGYTFLVFIYLDKKVKYEHWAVQMTFIYYGTTLFPFILFASGKKFYNSKIILVMNSFLCVILWIASFVVNFVTVNQSISFEYLFFSTAFVFILIILLIIFIIFF